jgi:DNA replication protein DnaC
VIRKMADGVFFDYQTLLERIRSGFDPQSGATDREAYRTALDSELLLLDDLGAHRASDFTQDVVTGLLTHRCNHGKPIIVTTNLAMEQQNEKDTAKTLGEVIGWRAVSRLHEMCRIYKMPINTDYRMRKR